MPEPISIPLYLHEWRKRLGIRTSAEAAKLLSCGGYETSKRTFDGWEQGRRPQSPATLLLACERVEQRAGGC